MERHLAECEDCRAELDGHRRVLGELLQTIPEQQPAPELRDRVLAAVAADPGRPGLETVPAGGADVERKPARHRRRRFVPAQVALGAYAAAATAAVVYLVAGQSPRTATVANMPMSMPPITSPLQSRPVLTSGPLSKARAALVRVNGRRVLVMVEVPKPTFGQVWQVWALSTGGDAAVPIVAFDQSQSSVAVDLSRIPEADVVAVTLEPMPMGSEPTGVPVLQTPI